MSEVKHITLQFVDASELFQFTKDIQTAFGLAVEEKYGSTGPIPSDKEIQEEFELEDVAT